MKKAILIVLLVSLSACAVPRQYHHPTASAYQQQLDKAQCKYELDMRTATWDIAQHLVLYSDLFNSCMAAKGYWLQR